MYWLTSFPNANFPSSSVPSHLHSHPTSKPRCMNRWERGDRDPVFSAQKEKHRACLVLTIAFGSSPLFSVVHTVVIHLCRCVCVCSAFSFLYNIIPFNMLLLLLYSAIFPILSLSEHRIKQGKRRLSRRGRWLVVTSQSGRIVYGNTYTYTIHGLWSRKIVRYILCTYTGPSKLFDILLCTYNAYTLIRNTVISDNFLQN